MPLRKSRAYLIVIATVAALSACGSEPPPDHQFFTTDDHFGSSAPSQGAASSQASTPPSAPQTVELCGPHEVRVIKPDEPRDREDVVLTFCIKSKNVWVATTDKGFTAYTFLNLSPISTDGKGSNVKTTVPTGAVVVYLTDNPKQPLCMQDLNAAKINKNNSLTVSASDASHCVPVVATQ